MVNFRPHHFLNSSPNEPQGYRLQCRIDIQKDLPLTFVDYAGYGSRMAMRHTETINYNYFEYYFRRRLKCIWISHSWRYACYTRLRLWSINDFIILSFDSIYLFIYSDRSNRHKSCGATRWQLGSYEHVYFSGHNETTQWDRQMMGRCTGTEHTACICGQMKFRIKFWNHDDDDHENGWRIKCQK